MLTRNTSFTIPVAQWRVLGELRDQELSGSNPGHDELSLLAWGPTGSFALARESIILAIQMVLEHPIFKYRPELCLKEDV